MSASFYMQRLRKELSLWSVPAAGGSPGRVAGSGDGGYNGLSGRRTEQWIVYIKIQPTGRGGTLAKLRVGSGEKPVQITKGCLPSWSPSGEWILCTGNSLRLLSPDGARTGPSARAPERPLGRAMVARFTTHAEWVRPRFWSAWIL